MITSSILQVPEFSSAVLPGLDSLYETINGLRVELPPMSAYAGILATRLSTRLNDFARTDEKGEAVVDVLFRLPAPLDRNRRPDVAFVSRQRWPLDRPMPVEENAWDVVPDLAVEVVSPNDIAEDLQEKIEEYFQAGVQLVWIVYPRRRVVHIYEGPLRIRGLSRSEVLEGGTVLPGFRLPLASLFIEAENSA